MQSLCICIFNVLPAPWAYKYVLVVSFFLTDIHIGLFTMTSMMSEGGGVDDRKVDLHFFLYSTSFLEINNIIIKTPIYVAIYY